MNHWIALACAVVAEVIATSTLKSTAEFTKFWPSLVVVIGYMSAFYFMTLSLRTLPLGIVYGIWCGLGIVLVALIGWFFYKQPLDLAAVIGMGLIIAGIVTINLFSKTVHH